MIRAAAVWLLTSVLLASSFVSMADETSVVSRTLSVLKAEGENARVNRSGVKELPAFDGMGLSQGDCVTTGMDTAVYIQADDDKTVKMDQNSMVEISKVSSRKLKMTLKSGELFFHVENHLADDETVEFDAAGTTLSIRGTAGLFSCHGDQVSLYLLEGTVVWTVNGQPVTIRAGQRMTATVVGETASGGLTGGLVSEFTADDFNAFELEAVLEHRDRLELPAVMGLTAAGDLGRLTQKASELRQLETETLARAAAENNMTLASLSQNEPGGGSYEVIQDEGSDDDSYPLSDSVTPPDETEEPERPKIDFDISHSGALYDEYVHINNITNVSEEETAYVRIMVLPDDEAVSFESVGAFMEFNRKPEAIKEVIANGTAVTVEIHELLDAQELKHGAAIHIYAAVWTDEEVQNGYARCKLETLRAIVIRGSESSVIRSK